MGIARKGLGAAGERLARRHLERQGYEILAANVRFAGLGELDLVARDGGFLVFVEVRTRRGDGFGSPEDSLSDGKRARLAALAAAWLEDHGDETSPWRVDLVAIEMDAHGKVVRTEIVRDAVEDAC
jgi:putative endonuclease